MKIRNKKTRHLYNAYYIDSKNYKNGIDGFQVKLSENDVFEVKLGDNKVYFNGGFYVVLEESGLRFYQKNAFEELFDIYTDFEFDLNKLDLPEDFNMEYLKNLECLLTEYSELPLEPISANQILEIFAFKDKLENILYNEIDETYGEKVTESILSQLPKYEFLSKPNFYELYDALSRVKIDKDVLLEIYSWFKTQLEFACFAKDEGELFQKFFNQDGRTYIALLHYWSKGSIFYIFESTNFSIASPY